MHNVECPYCDRTQKVELDGSDNFDQECKDCGEEFEVTVECEPIVNSSKIEHRTCVDCHRTYRSEGRSHPIPKKYKDIKMDMYNICGDCYRRELFRDYSPSK